MEIPSTFAQLFHQWPDALPRRGIVTNALNEAMPFKGFMLKDDLLLLERTNPDPAGTRFIMLQFDAITSVKLLDPLKEASFTPLGFTGKLSQL